MTHEEWIAFDEASYATAREDVREALATCARLEEVDAYALRLDGYLGHGCRQTVPAIIDDSGCLSVHGLSR